MSSILTAAIFTTVIALFLLLPGFILRGTYFGSNNGLLETNTLTIDFIWALVWSLILYFISIVIINCCGLFVIVDTNVIYRFLFGQNLTILETNIVPFLPEIAAYFIIINLFAFALGWILKRAVVKFNFDVYFQSLRFKNDWYYFLSGRELLFLGEQKSKLYNQQKYSTELYFLCETDNRSIIYKGLLYDYQLNKSAFEYIAIKGVRRFLLTDDLMLIPNIHPIYIKIKAEFLIFKYEEIKNIAVSYVPFVNTET